VKRWSLFVLRISLALLMLVWGADKLVNPEHGARVAERFYFGIMASERLIPLLGVAQMGLAVLLALGLFRRFTYLALAAVTGMTLIGVWRSVLDPLGLWLGGGNLLFFPSLIIFAAVVVLIAFRDEDRLALGR
jgi:putative oxidoreductase